MEFIELSISASIDGDRHALPPFLGATLRGALGYLLKHTVCQVSHGICGSCLLQPACPYPIVFEGIPPEQRDWMRKYPRIPQPFVLIVDPPQDRLAEGTALRWGVRLFGMSRRYWPYVVHVFQRAGEQGLGKSRIVYRMDEIRDGLSGERLVDEHGVVQTQPTVANVFDGLPTLSENCALRWRFLTPTHIVDRSGRIDGLSLLLSARRRLKTLWYFYGVPTERPDSRFESEEFQTEDNNLKRFGFSRFSGRQQRTMDLKGLMGEMVIRGPWGRATELLAAIPRIHVGKSTSFGFGRVTWEPA